jgi:hypothetical protein
MDLGHAGPFALAVLWLAVAATLATRPPAVPGDDLEAEGR